MFSRIMAGSSDINRSKSFHDLLFSSVGGKPGITDPKGGLICMHNGGIFFVIPPIDSQPGTSGNGMTIGFAMNDPAQGGAWYKAGVAVGGKAIEDRAGAVKAQADYTSRTCATPTATSSARFTAAQRWTGYS